MSTEQALYQASAKEVFDAGRTTTIHIQALGAHLLSEFAQAQRERTPTEERWLDDLRQHKGQYSSEETAHMTGASRVFVRKTRSKVKTVNSRVADMLFPASGQANWSITPTPIPTLSAQQQDKITAQLNQASQAGQPIEQAHVQDLINRLANEAAQAMATLISDQLTETRYRRESLKAINDCHIYGTGCLKGPIVARKARTTFKPDRNHQYRPQQELYIAPQVRHIPIWDIYPDMSSADLEGCRYLWQRHTMSAPDMAELAATPGFDAAIIRDYILAHPQGHSTHSTQTTASQAEIRRMGNRHSTTATTTHTYEVLERWGWLTGQELRQAGIHVSPERHHESFFSCIWMLASGEVIRAHLTDIDGSTYPYHFYHFDKDETNFFSEGIPAIMRDDQTMINAATRLLLDNAALSSGPMWEVTPSLLANSAASSLQDIHAWRIWLRNSQSPGQPAVRPIAIDGRLGDLQAIKAMFEAGADESTAIPRYMTGENPSAGAAGTASGMSMLMAAANIVIKDLITNWDEGITRPLIEAFYHWNMRHSSDDAIKGDYQISATGTTSLVAKEVRSRQLNEFATLVANPFDAPYIKRDALNRLRAQAHELPDIVKTEQEVEQEMQATQNDQAQAMQQQIMQMQLQEAQAKIQEAAARAQLDNARAQESLARAQAALAKADESAASADLMIAKKLDAAMEALYASLQAAGITLANPQTAPIADALLAEAGGLQTLRSAQAQMLQASNNTNDSNDTNNAATTAQTQAQEQAQIPSALGAHGAQPASGKHGIGKGIHTAQLGD